jgi:magnesium-transporting ATPase (P-type)
MNEFIQIILNFPTLFYTVLLSFISLFWLSTILGLADIDTLDGNVDLDVDADPAANTLAVWLNKFKLEGIPLTITLSLIILTSWVLCFLGVYFIYPHLPTGWVGVAIGFWLIVLTPIMAAIIISPFLQPLKPLFKKEAAQSSFDFLGKTATVRTGKVTLNFGEAEVSDGAAGLIIKIRAEEPNDIQRGDKVILENYNTIDSTYQITKIQNI